jgi:AraC-like DNA-binding protein
MNRGQDPGTATSSYREFRPPPALAEFLLCFWTQTVSPSSGFTQRVLPDCCVDILLTNGQPTVIGPWTEPFDAHLPAGTQIFGARCHPGLASSLLGVPASELLNLSVPLCDLWGSGPTAAYLRAADQSTLAAQAQAMEAALLNRAARARPIDSTTRNAIQWIAQHPHASVEKLSPWLGLSSRQIQRRFVAAVGYGPKMFQSVLRFQRLLHLAAEAGIPGNLAQFAADAEYADQAHMTREVQRFSGTTPSVLLPSSRSTLGLSSLI